MGMLAAVEAWVKRDYQAEFKVWESWLATISKTVTSRSGRDDRSTAAERFIESFSATRDPLGCGKIGITGREVEKHVYDTEPRIVLGNASGDRRSNTPSSVTIMPYMMQPEDHKVVAERLRAVLSSPPTMPQPAKPQGPLANIDGQWKLNIRYFSRRFRSSTSVRTERQGLVWNASWRSDHRRSPRVS